MIFYLKENKRKKKKVYLKESSIMLLMESNNSKAARNDRIFLFESTNSKKAAERTRVVISDYIGKSVDDPEVIEAEHYFKREAFGEGAKKDWFVPIEPIACEWWLKDGRDDGKIKNAIGNLVSKAGRVNDRLGFMNQIKALKNMKEVRHFVAKCKKEDRQIARETGVDTTTRNENYDVSGPLSFDEAHTYYTKTGGNGASCPICYCQYRNTWLGPMYSDNDKNKLYILFRKDWEKYNNPEMSVHDGSQVNNGLGSPYNELNAYDDYGNYKVDLHAAKGYTVQSIMKPDGTFLWNHPKGKWFMGVEPMIGGPKNLYKALICYVNNGKPSRNLIDENGNFVLSENAEYIDKFRNGFARVRNIDGSKYYLDTSLRPHEPTQELDDLYDRRPARRA